MRLLLFALTLALAAPLPAWHTAGHRVIAAITYDALNKSTRTRVDELIRRHPDYSKFTEGVAGSPKHVARWAFINASAWADDIKGDDRFFDDTRRDAKPTPTRLGFPDMKRHTNWHYINLYFSPDGTPFPPPPSPNALTQLKIFIEAMGKPGSADAVYYLPWLVHVEGDVHQPMHCVSRFTRFLTDRNGKPISDLGGNLVNVDGYTNLHSVWDGLLGSVSGDEQYIDWMAARLTKESKPEAVPVTDPRRWVDEGFDLAKTEAYQFPANAGTATNPFRPSPQYWKNAVRIAHRRAALAGYRLAAILNERLK